MQDCCNSTSLALELLQSCTKAIKMGLIRKGQRIKTNSMECSCKSSLSIIWKKNWLRYEIYDFWIF